MRTLESNRMAGKTTLFVGTAGYSYPDWKGRVYPKDLKKQVKSEVPELTYLAQFLNLCEINSTFYGHFAPKTAVKWCRAVAEVSEDFQFAIKANQAFTHAAGTKPTARKGPTSVETLKYTQEDLEKTKAFLDVFVEQEKLIVLLFQFPVSFKFKTRDKDGKEVVLEGSWDYLADLMKLFADYPQAVEFRHNSWNDPWVLAGLREKQITFCNIDEPRLGSSLQGTTHVTSPLIYERLHGRNYKKWFRGSHRDERYDYLYSEGELKVVAEAIETMQKKTEQAADTLDRKTIIVANNHYQGQAAVNALQLKSMLTGTKVEAPEELLKTYPGLERFTVRPRGSLF